MLNFITGGVCAAQGFRAGGIHVGVKTHAAWKKDVALIVSDEDCACAAVYTKNAVKAAHIHVDKRHLADGKARAAVINSGNANACAPMGEENAERVCAAAGKALGCRPEDVVVAATGVMFIFSILFFGILTDAGTFRPIIRTVLNLVGTDPIKIAIGTAVLAAIVHLDGSGAVTFLICVPALLPLYDALGMRRTTLATIVALSAGTMNILPWGGPTIRAHTALASMTGTEPTVTEFFMPVLPAVLVGLVLSLIHI